MLLRPWHLTDQLGDGFHVTPPGDVVVVAGRPGTIRLRWRGCASRQQA